MPQDKRPPHDTYKRLLGARILSEANDLKRTSTALARDVGWAPERVAAVIEGRADAGEALELVDRMGDAYPIDSNDLRLIEDDCDHGVKIMTAAESAETSRVFDRRDRNGTLTPYYEYRDTAMSRLSPYRPEWIRELRLVDDDDPDNDDVAFNNGHFMHQFTMFVGDVNFYWGVPGQRRARRMATEDSMYITPYVPHSFATRDPSLDSFILAVTFGAHVRRAQKELYVIGDRARQWHLGRGRAASMALLRQHMADSWVTENQLEDFSLETLSQGDGPFSEEERRQLASRLGLRPKDLEVDDDDPEVALADHAQTPERLWPSADQPAARLRSLAVHRRLPQMRGAAVEITARDPQATPDMVSSLHGWVYNHSDHAARLSWRDAAGEFSRILEPGDSAYTQPFVPLRWTSETDRTARLCMIRIAGSVSQDTQLDYSAMHDPDRVLRETCCWFD